jgi:hypothetical protein
MTWLAIRLFLSSIPRWVWASLAVLALLAGVWLHGRSSGADGVQARWDKQEAAYALQRAEASLAARATEQRHRAEYAAIAGRFLAQQKEADETHDRTVADLRRGALRVQNRLTCPSGRAEAATDAARAIAAGQAGLLPADAEFLLREAARADAVARQLNALIEAVRAGQR